MADLNAILKNKMGLSVEQAKKSKILASLSGSYRQNMKSIHYSQLVPSTNQFYTEKELEDLADIIQILGGVAQNLLVRKRMQNSMKFWPDTAGGGPARSLCSVAFQNMLIFRV